MVELLNESNFDQFFESNKIAIIVEELSHDLEGKAGVAKLNTDENQAIAIRFNINAIPTLLVFKDSVLVDSLIGLRPKEDILEYVNGL